MTENNPLYPLVFFFLSALLAFKVIRLSEDRGARYFLSRQLAGIALLSAVLAWTQTAFLCRRFEVLHFAQPVLAAAEASVAALCLYWLLFRKRWQGHEKRNDMISCSLLLSTLTALAFWGGNIEVGVWIWFERLILAAVFLFFFTPALVAIEWRTAISPVPKIFKGEPILLISSGLLALGLLGLSKF